MEITAVNKSVHISPRKVRLVADSVRSLSVDHALGSLKLINKRAALAIGKTLTSALANAKHNAQLDPKQLTIAAIEVTEGPAFKRYHPSTRGRIHPYKKRSSHIRIVLKDKEGKE